MFDMYAWVLQHGNPPARTHLAEGAKWTGFGVRVPTISTFINVWVPPGLVTSSGSVQTYFRIALDDGIGQPAGPPLLNVCLVQNGQDHFIHLAFIHTCEPSPRAEQGIGAGWDAPPFTPLMPCTCISPVPRAVDRLHTTIEQIMFAYRWKQMQQETTTPHTSGTEVIVWYEACLRMEGVPVPAKHNNLEFMAFQNRRNRWRHTSAS